MALLNKRLTQAETAAIYLHVFGNCSDWVQLYAIADGIKDTTRINRSTVYKWKNSVKIVDLIRDLQREKQALTNNENNTAQRTENGQITTDTDRDNGTADSVRTENATRNGRPKFIDFSRPENQTAKLNELVNTASDPGEALDALKVIIQGQRADRDAAKEGRTVRAYLPVSCSDCPLYEKARKKVTI